MEQTDNLSSKPARSVAGVPCSEQPDANSAAALEDENPEVFLLALRDVVEANSTMSELARAIDRNRESLYKTLSEKGNPQLNSVRSILNQIGFKLAVEVNQSSVNS